MSRWLCLLLLVCASAHAAPDATTSDDTMARFLHEKSLLLQFEEMRSNVAGRTSDLVVTAMGFLGVPYRRGGNSAETGFDCSGFVRAMYEQTVGLILPRKASQQATATEVIDKKDLQPGDLVFFNTMRRAFSHVGIYVGDGKFIHSPRSGSEVRVEDMRQAYWQRRFDGARRVTPDALAQQ
ncbi:C40 family peptidase [Paenacidovorax monticola]|uniref:C40 family peptidase n=1 Tax=Paenacidovorax monticola TaxID=1926868 RepID=A0A7H0HI94_9BURK|nr:C40 family peptidase [Paenacidovorax monticola]QNP60260.1 C40 family peptidase [Paenacidovorax monticola]